MSVLVSHIENQNINLSQTKAFAAIIGESPSKGAKSPILWNAAFKDLGINAVMHPFDVTREKLPGLVQSLRNDKTYIGGAVTMPYKVDLVSLLDAVEPEAENIGAINCIYRQNDKLVGANTDGAGALWSLEQSYGEVLEGKKVLLLGTGGAGRAVAAYIASAIGLDGVLYLANRNVKSCNEVAKKLKNICRIVELDRWPVDGREIQNVDIVINCTSVGFETVKEDKKGAYSLKPYTPLASVDDTIRVPVSSNAENEFLMQAAKDIQRNQLQSQELLKGVNKPFVFDIIYQPLETSLIQMAKSLGSKTLNGLGMNLEQAVIAFNKSVVGGQLYSGEINRIRSAMRLAK